MAAFSPLLSFPREILTAVYECVCEWQTVRQTDRQTDSEKRETGWEEREGSIK